MDIATDTGHKSNASVVSEKEEGVLDGDENKRKYDVMNRLYTDDTRPHHEHDYQTPHQN
jgi:hypothetical protein